MEIVNLEHLEPDLLCMSNMLLLLKAPLLFQNQINNIEQKQS